MIVRMGHVLYWAACAIAASWLFFALIGTGTETTTNWAEGGAIGLVGAVLFWLIGRAIKYALACR